MADAYARMSGTVAALSVHQGCGLTNAMTGITEAAKSRTPLLVLAAEATTPLSNFYVDQPALAGAVGAVSLRGDVRRDRRRRRRRGVLDGAPRPAHRGAQPAARRAGSRGPGRRRRARRDAPDAPVPVDGRRRRPGSSTALAAAPSGRSSSPAAAARGAGCREALEALAERSGALLATSAVANGLFDGNPWSLGISGGFASPLAAELIRGADLIVGWGCALNMWTMSHGALIGPDATRRAGRRRAGGARTQPADHLRRRR